MPAEAAKAKVSLRSLDGEMGTTSEANPATAITPLENSQGALPLSVSLDARSKCVRRANLRSALLTLAC